MNEKLNFIKTCIEVAIRMIFKYMAYGLMSSVVLIIICAYCELMITSANMLFCYIRKNHFERMQDVDCNGINFWYQVICLVCLVIFLFVCFIRKVIAGARLKISIDGHNE